MKTNYPLKPILAAAALLVAGQAFAQVTFYAGEGFRGQVFRTDRQVGNLERQGFNDRASSVVVERGRWEVCEDARFEGRCVVLRKGSYDSLQTLGLQNEISSVRPIGNNSRYDGESPQGLTEPNYEYRRRPNERLYEAPVTSVRAVVGESEQRCWTERQQQNEQRRDLNPAGGVIGGLLGGIIGHQIGGGSGKTAATIGGAVAGGALGANVDRIRDPVSGRDVRRCENVANTTPQYYDVVYNYRGIDHRVQMATAPGRTISVNNNGEPRM